MHLRIFVTASQRAQINNADELWTINLDNSGNTYRSAMRNARGQEWARNNSGVTPELMRHDELTLWPDESHSLSRAMLVCHAGLTWY
jgi:hypothetical protein